MAKVEGEILIGRSAEEVFDFVVGQSNEPRYNPRWCGPRKSPSMGRTAEMLVEGTGYDRPRRFASVTTMRQADISYTLTFEPAGTGTRMRWSGQVRPKRAYRLLGPLVTWAGRREERRIWPA